ncbi:MAG TPA: NUDIX hydrolase [Polyangia bacterium]|jgi:8-oxo-dGTP pyrophosphatase MutT (NUDIX family)|nr:NUDIX hydrolase [Polyangia bacterium]
MPDHFDDDPGLWKVLTREYLAKKPWYTVRVDRVELPNGTIIPEYWVSEYPPWVNVVALTERDEVVLIRQYRHGVEAVHYEIPAGSTDPEDKSMEAAARRELAEETGYVGGHWSLLATLSANPALQDNLTYTFLAEGVTPGPASPEASEEITVHLTPLDQIEALIDKGGFLQALHTAPLLKLLLRRAHAREGEREKAR